jgi:hypothetical protein
MHSLSDWGAREVMAQAAVSPSSADAPSSLGAHSARSRTARDLAAQGGGGGRAEEEHAEAPRRGLLDQPLLSRRAVAAATAGAWHAGHAAPRRQASFAPQWEGFGAEALAAPSVGAVDLAWVLGRRAAGVRFPGEEPHPRSPPSPARSPPSPPSPPPRAAGAAALGSQRGAGAGAGAGLRSRRELASDPLGARVTHISGGAVHLVGAHAHGLRYDDLYERPENQTGAPPPPPPPPPAARRCAARCDGARRARRAGLPPGLMGGEKREHLTTARRQDRIKNLQRLAGVPL